MSNAKGLAVVIVPFVAIIGVLLAIYHFLVFPNIDGVALGIDWINYYEGFQHFLYWFGFWIVIIFGSALRKAIKSG